MIVELHTGHVFVHGSVKAISPVYMTNPGSEPILRRPAVMLHGVGFKVEALLSHYAPYPPQVQTVEQKRLWRAADLAEQRQKIIEALL